MSNATTDSISERLKALEEEIERLRSQRLASPSERAQPPSLRRQWPTRLLGALFGQAASESATGTVGTVPTGGTPAEDAQVGYTAAIDLWVFAGQVIWDRFNAMLVANSIVLLAIVYSLTGSRQLDFASVGLSLAGIFLCGLWYPTMRRSYDFQRYYSACATEQEQRLRGVATASRGRAFASGEDVSLMVPPRDGGSPVPQTQRMSLAGRLVPRGRSSNLVIAIFMIAYAILLYEAVDSHIHDPVPGSSNSVPPAIGSPVVRISLDDSVDCCRP